MFFQLPDRNGDKWQTFVPICDGIETNALEELNGHLLSSRTCRVEKEFALVIQRQSVTDCPSRTGKVHVLMVTFKSEKRTVQNYASYIQTFI